MNGALYIVGLGPGPDCWTTPEAASALARVDALVGYKPYVARVPERAGLERFCSDNRSEMERARHALKLAQEGRVVAVVSGGDPGVFAMAAAVFEAVDADDPQWREVDIRVLPGVSAMQAAAARLGAPLGHDFCVISLSDNLKPWDIVGRRLIAAAQGDFVVCLYNPASKARPQRIHDAFALLRDLKDGSTLVAFARAVGRSDESLLVTTLAEADPGFADMSTLVLIGSSETRRVAGRNGAGWLLTPRSYGGGR